MRAPAKRFTAVWLVSPPPGIAPRSAPPTFASPVASNSLLACGEGSSLRTKAHPAAIVSVKTHEHDAQGAGPESSREGECRSSKPRQALEI